MSDSLRLYGLYPARLLCPWDFPGKNTGMDCHAQSSRGSSQPRDRIHISVSPAPVGGFFITSSTWKSPFHFFTLSRPSKDWVIPIHVTEGSVVKNLSANVEEAGSISGSGISLGGGNGNSLQCSCLENPMDRGAWRVTVHGVAESQT